MSLALIMTTTQMSIIIYLLRGGLNTSRPSICLPFCPQDNKDILSNLTGLPPGDTQEVVCKNKAEALSDKRAIAKATRLVTHGDVDHQIRWPGLLECIHMWRKSFLNPL
jgi:hypothetical protein